jgi:hypothetical protein
MDHGAFDVFRDLIVGQNLRMTVSNRLTMPGG